MPRLHRKHVVITRPAGQANHLRELIKQEGGEVSLFPLIDIAPLDDDHACLQVLAALPQYDWVIFISSNAVVHGMPKIRHACANLPAKLRFAAIGPVTAQHLGEFGITEVLVPENRFDSESLLALPEMQAMQGKKCMIVRGVGGREVLAATLRSRGAEVTFAECYQRVNPQTDATLLHTLWQNKALDAIVVTSSEAMRHLLALAPVTGSSAVRLPDWLCETTICVNHARIAEEAGHTGLNIRVASAPGDEAMLRCIVSALE